LSANETTHEAIVIGAGVAGLAAARDIARLGVSVALVDSGYLGGLLINVGALDGQAAFEGQSGADVVNDMLGEVLESGADYQMDEVAALEAIILATGADLRRLGVPGEEELMGRGVSQCAFCDGGLYRDKDVIVIGGGDAAFQEALHLADMCGVVTIAMRGAAPRARTIFVEKANAAGNIKLRTNTDVREIVGETGVDAVRLYNQALDQETVEPFAAIFPFIGVAPQTRLAGPDLERDADGALIVDAMMRTKTANLFAIGAARAGYGGQVPDALADAAAVASGFSQPS
jgi:thioredoxin reductase (NADPH)